MAPPFEIVDIGIGVSIVRLCRSESGYGNGYRKNTHTHTQNNNVTFNRDKIVTHIHSYIYRNTDLCMQVYTQNTF